MDITLNFALKNMLGSYYWEIFSYHYFRKDGGTLRQMNAEKLLKTLPQLQNQLDALVDFEVKHWLKLEMGMSISKIEFIIQLKFLLSIFSISVYNTRLDKWSDQFSIHVIVQGFDPLVRML